MFCPKCSSILRPIVKEGKKVVGCTCGYVSGESSMSVKEKVKEQDKIVIIEKEENVYPLVDARCPKCEHKKARHWEIQMRSSDEPATRFFKCEKCKHTWREYD